MAFTYQQSTGNLTDADGNLLASGYSGHGEGVNNPDLQSTPNVGPIPVGQYTIGSPHTPIDHLGPYALPLTPDPSNEMFGRSAFFMHGDFVGDTTHAASEGCIIMPLSIRTKVNSSDDKILQVIA